MLVLLGTTLASLLLLSGAQSGVQAPGAGWYSGNPLLGPSTLTSLASAGGTTYAAGNEGTLLKSTDGGLTWAGIATGIQDNLSLVRIAGDDVEVVAREIDGGAGERHRVAGLAAIAAPARGDLGDHGGCRQPARHPADRATDRGGGAAWHRD